MLTDWDRFDIFILGPRGNFIRVGVVSASSLLTVLWLRFSSCVLMFVIYGNDSSSAFERSVAVKCCFIYDIVISFFERFL